MVLSRVVQGHRTTAIDNHSARQEEKQRQPSYRSLWNCTRLFLLRLRRQDKKQLVRWALLLVVIPIVIIRIHKKRPYYYGPPVDIYLNHVNDPLSSKLSSSCPATIQKTSSTQDLAVIVVGSSRADYLGQVLHSLQRQTVNNFRVYIFLDYCQVDGCDKTLKLVQDTVQENAERYSFQRATENIGIARMTKWSIDSVLDDPTHVFERFLFLEDDHLIGHTYVEAMGMLLSASEHMPKVALVNGNFLDTPADQSRGELYGRHPYFIKDREDGCHFQIVEPMHANIDLNGHNAWAWATTRTKYKSIYPSLVKAFQEANMDTVPYMQRNRSLIAHVMDKYCPESGYNRWGGQDWLRACMFYHQGMTQKLQPTSRLMTYIGMRGLHMSPKVFNQSGFQPVSVEEVSKNVTGYPEQLCKGICNFKVVLTHDSLALFRKRKKHSLG